MLSIIEDGKFEKVFDPGRGQKSFCDSFSAADLLRITVERWRRLWSLVLRQRSKQQRAKEEKDMRHLKRVVEERRPSPTGRSLATEPESISQDSK